MVGSNDHLTAIRRRERAPSTTSKREAAASAVMSAPASCGRKPTLRRRRHRSSPFRRGAMRHRMGARIRITSFGLGAWMGRSHPGVFFRAAVFRPCAPAGRAAGEIAQRAADGARHQGVYSIFSPSFLVSAAHLPSSRSMLAAYSSGVLAIGSPPSAMIRFVIPSDSIIERSSLLSRSIMGRGV